MQSTKDGEVTYQMYRLCINCNKKLSVIVSYGESVPPVPDGTKCSYCGCEYFTDAFHPRDERVEKGVD